MKVTVLWTVLLTLFLSGCGDQDAGVPRKTLDAENCFSGKAIKTVSNQKGKVYYNPLEAKYAVYVSFPGTYDSQDAGFICDKLENLRKDGLIVRFSGNYYEYDEDRKPPIGGLKYYYLDVTEYEIVAE